jgi:RNA polymerase sigma-70 factor (ECF subfamily)
MGGNPADAEDALDTAMLRALRHYPTSGGQLINARAWLSRILRNVCMDFHRERRRFVEPSEERDGPEPAGPRVPVEAAPDEVLLERESASEIREHIHALPPNLRKPFVMRFLQDMSYDDIAMHLQLTNCNVRKRIQLAYGILRVTLAEANLDR